MTVTFVDLKSAFSEIRSEIEDAAQRVLESGWYIGGAEVAAFEEAYASYCFAKHCVGVGNGLDALHLTLRAMEIGAGDEVILASNSFIATVLAVTNVGAKPVLVEPDPQTYNLAPERVEAAITGQTKVILPTHLYGQPADVDALVEVGRRHGLRIVEDAAQAHGARYKDRPIGAHSDAVTWSFYPTKNLGALGDAGAITTNDSELAKRVRMLGNYGSSKRYFSELQGLNSRLDPLQAAVLSVKLRYLDAWNDRRREIALSYSTALGGCGFILPFVPDWAEPAWHLYVIRTASRNLLQEELAKQGIETLIHYPVPPHLQKAYADLDFRCGSYPIAEQLSEQVLSLPIGPHLSQYQVDEVIGAIQWASGALKG